MTTTAAAHPGSTSRSNQSLGENTLLTMQHIFPTAQARDANIKAFGSVQGAIDNTNRLAEHLIHLQAKSR